MSNREIAFACRGIFEDTEITVEKHAEKRETTNKTFFEVMEMTANETWKTSNKENPHIFFYQEEEGTPILQEDETDYNPDEIEGYDDIDDFHYFVIWRNNICEERLKKAAEWLSSRQSAIQKCHELGLRPFITIDVQGNDEYLNLPSEFVSVCGQANLRIELSFKYTPY